VRQVYGAPLAIIECRSLCTGHITAREAPTRVE
jgi:hypothetical protein